MIHVCISESLQRCGSEPLDGSATFFDLMNTYAGIRTRRSKKQTYQNNNVIQNIETKEISESKQHASPKFQDSKVPRFFRNTSKITMIMPSC